MTPHDTELRQLALATLFPGFEGTLAPAWLLDRVAEGLAGVVLFERNVPSEHSGDTLVTLSGALRRARPDVIVAVDEEGGDVTRLDAASGSNLPGAAALGVFKRR